MPMTNIIQQKSESEIVAEYIDTLQRQLDLPDNYNIKVVMRELAVKISESTAHAVREEAVRAERKKVIDRIEQMKFVGKYAHDGDIYTPNEINEMFDELKAHLTDTGV